jgi:hypothetical protein
MSDFHIMARYIKAWVHQIQAQKQHISQGVPGRDSLNKSKAG